MARSKESLDPKIKSLLNMLPSPPTTDIDEADTDQYIFVKKKKKTASTRRKRSLPSSTSSASSTSSSSSSSLSTRENNPPAISSNEKNLKKSLRVVTNDKKSNGPRRSLKSEETVDVKEEFKTFDWKRSAAQYIFRVKLMQDYLNQYVDALASYRQVREESLDTLMRLLIRLSDSRPSDDEDFITLMPPNISGLVYNQTTFTYPDDKRFDVQEILSRDPELFEVTTKPDGTRIVRYLRNRSKTEAFEELRMNLVEGIFLYFLAKFCHESKFPIKTSYYQRSEPVRSSLIYATGCRRMRTALKAYFDAYPDIFILDEDVTYLEMKENYFDKRFRSSLRIYLNNNNNGRKVTTSGVVQSILSSTTVMIHFRQSGADHYAILTHDLSTKIEIGKSVYFQAKYNRGKHPKCDWIAETFWFEDGTLFNVVGFIRAVLTPKSGIVRFTHNRMEEEAYFTTDEVNIKGQCIDPSRSLLKKDYKVIFNAVRQQEYRGVRYRCSKVEICQDQEEEEFNQILSRVQETLGPPDFGQDYGRVVCSVVRKVLDEDAAKSIVDPCVLEPFLDGVTVDKDRFMHNFELQVRKLFAKMLFENVQ